jgi:hypothetical protein
MARRRSAVRSPLDWQRSGFPAVEPAKAPGPDSAVGGAEIRGGWLVGPDRPAWKEMTQDLRALAERPGFKFRAAAQGVEGPYCHGSGKPVVGLIHFLLSLLLAYHCFATGLPMGARRGLETAFE